MKRFNWWNLKATYLNLFCISSRVYYLCLVSDFVEYLNHWFPVELFSRRSLHGKWSWLHSVWQKKRNAVWLWCYSRLGNSPRRERDGHFTNYTTDLTFLSLFPSFYPSFFHLPESSEQALCNKIHSCRTPKSIVGAFHTPGQIRVLWDAAFLKERGLVLKLP